MAAHARLVHGLPYEPCGFQQTPEARMSSLREHTLPTPFSRTFLALGLSIALGGCVAIANGGQHEDEVTGGAGPGDDPFGDSSASSDEDLASRERCRESTAQAKTFLEAQCASCHTEGAPDNGGFTSVLDINTMIDDGLIVPGSPDQSKLYTSLKGKTMPPASSGKSASTQDVKNVHDWIACGAPSQARAADAPEFVDIDERLQNMVKDLKTFDPADRKDVRYLDLYELSNAGFSEAELDVYRQALSFVMNSLSRGTQVVPPQRVDDRGLLFRIELNDYGWTTETWGALADAYPYAVQYDEDSQLFPYDETSNAKIREETGEPIPYVQADWFISNCSRPPLYNQLLGLPETLDGLADKLGVNIQDDIDNGQAVRAGLRQAGSSQYDRVLERHELPGSAGALWISYGFNSGVGKSDVFAHPLDFEPAGIQAMFSLKNGLSGYMVFDAQGRAIDKAPNDIEQDPHARDGAAETGISCLSCHAQGHVAVKDEVRDSLTSSAVDASVLAGVRRLYAPQETIDALFKDDIQRFSEARNRSLSPLVQEQTIHEIDDRHLDVLTLSEVAGVLGMPATELDRGINAAPQRVPDSIRTLRKDGAFVRRDAFEADFADLVTALSLGTPYSREQFLSGNSSDDSNDSSNNGSSSDDSGTNGSSDDGSATNEGSSTGDDGSSTGDDGSTGDASDPAAPSDGSSDTGDSDTGDGSGWHDYP
jgi:hypothetical protein